MYILVYIYIYKGYYLHKHYAHMRVLCAILPGKFKIEKFSKLLFRLNKSKIYLSTENNYFCIYYLRLYFSTLNRVLGEYRNESERFKKKNRIIKYYFDTKRVQFGMMIRKRRLCGSKRVK